MFDQEGNFVKENEIILMLRNSANWMAEYLKIKKILKKIRINFDTSIAHSLNIKKNWTITWKNTKYCLKTQKSKFYYQILIDHKYESNYMHKKWENEFTLENTDWKNIYKGRVWDLKDRKLAEFNYKLLNNINNIICTKSIISKWNSSVNSLCPLCDKQHTIKHLLYECEKINNIWAIIGNILKVDIKYKHIVIGNISDNEYVQARNLLISYCSYAIYKMWIMFENDKIDYRSICMRQFIAKDLFSRTLYNENNHFKMLCDKVIKKL